MAVLSLIFGVLAVVFAATSLVLFKSLKRLKSEIQELLRETTLAEEPQQNDSGDIYFKIDDSFNLTFINDAGAKELGYQPEFLCERALTETILENNDANTAFLKEIFAKISKKQSTVTSQLLLKRRDGKTLLMLVRIRPLLNEILKCTGLSFLCKDLSQADRLKSELSDYQSIDPFTDILNEKTLLTRFEHDFNLANRYNKELSTLVIELKDIYAFISKGIDFETADKMLKNICSMCLESLPPEGYTGRIDKTKIFMVLKNTPRAKAAQLAGDILKSAVEIIKTLRIDESNAQMIIISYSNRKGFADSYDAMIGRIQRHINTALKQKIYGIFSSDSRQTTLSDLENIKG